MIGRGSIRAAAVTVFFETLRKRYGSTFSTLLMPIFLVVIIDLNLYEKISFCLSFRKVSTVTSDSFTMDRRIEFRR